MNERMLCWLERVAVWIQCSGRVSEEGMNNMIQNVRNEKKELEECCVR
jgi:hypothetical protein